VLARQLSEPPFLQLKLGWRQIGQIVRWTKLPGRPTVVLLGLQDNAITNPLKVSMDGGIKKSKGDTFLISLPVFQALQEFGNMLRGVPGVSCQ
jgi:hypothetical protein